MSTNDYYRIEIYTDDNPRPVSSLVDELKTFSTSNTKEINKNKKNKNSDDTDTVLISNIKKDKKSKKKKKKSVLLENAVEFESRDNDDEVKSSVREIDDDTLLDIESILKDRDEYDDIEGDLTNKGKSGYKELKKNKNNYKKEFAEELTLLYSLLDETSKFGKTLEKDFNSLKGSKVRGTSKYTNELAQLVLTAKSNKLNILKEINNTKKTIADLTMKAEAKTKDNENKNNPEYLASAYFKNVLMHGRSNFIDNMTTNNDVSSYINDEFDDYESMIDSIEKSDKPSNDEDMYNRILMDRLESSGNPNRSIAGSKYIEYENKGVKIYVKKCIDTGEWEFVAIDKSKQQIDDYPLPTKRDAGRMRFSDDGTYATDSKGRIYSVIEYFLPEDE